MKGTGLVFGSDGITLNCAGYSINYVGTGKGKDGVLLSGSLHHDVIENCIVNGFKNGYQLSNQASHNTLINDEANGSSVQGFLVSSSAFSTFTNDTASSSTYGFTFQKNSHNDTLVQDTANGNTKNGFNIFNSSNMTFVNDTATFNGNDGFYIKESHNENFTDDNGSLNSNGGFVMVYTRHGLLATSVANGNGGDGFSLSKTIHTTLEADIADENGLAGFNLAVHSSINLLELNTADNNSGSGFNLQSAINNTLLLNTAQFNVADGFTLDLLSGINNITSNTGNNNTGYGFNDGSSGPGTASTNNTYTSNTCLGDIAGDSSPAGLCSVSLIQNLTLTSPNSQEDGEFGFNVAISGNLVVVGAPSENAYNNASILSAGNAYVFNATTGALIQSLTSPNAQEDGAFGWSVAISGTTVVVGAIGEASYGNPNYGSDGNAYVFNATTGALISNLTTPNPQPEGSGFFGWSVAISGNTVVVGAPYENSSADPSQFSSGNAYVYDATNGSLLYTLLDPNPQDSGGFGYSVSVDGNTAIVGAPFEAAATNASIVSAGNAYTFDTTSGNLLLSLTSPNAQYYGTFGLSVGISGNTVVVGANGENSSGLEGAGNVYTFDATTGSLIYTFTSPNPQAGGNFGSSVAITGSLVVVGAPDETTLGMYSAGGNAYTFNATTGTNIGTLVSEYPQYGGLFGCSVSVSGTSVAIGAYGETGSAGNSYVFPDQ